MTTWYIIRHAEKEKGEFYNPRLRHQDQPISQKGQRDAQKLNSFFSDKPISKIYVSVYQRTGQTIANVAQQLHITPIVDDRLNEIDNGCIEGLTNQEVMRKYPDIWDAYCKRATDFRFPEGETGEEAQKRIIGLLEETRQINNPGDIIFVTHDGLIRLLMCHIMQIPVWRRWKFRVDTCGITEISYKPNFQEWKLIRFNQVCQ